MLHSLDVIIPAQLLEKIVRLHLHTAPSNSSRSNTVSLPELIPGGPKPRNP